MLQVGRTAVAGADVGTLLSSVCTALPATLGVSGAAIVLVEVPDRLPGLAGVSASDTAAGRLGEMELRAGTGPVQGAVRSGRPMVTPDLTRIGPPELAAAAADTGLTCSVVVPLVVDGEPVGGLQLFGHPGRPVGDGHVDAVAGLADVLSARLTDVCALRRLTATVARLTAEHETALPVAHATGMLAERYRTDVEEAGRYLASGARKTGVEPAEAARAVLDRTDAPPAAGEDTPTQVFGVVTPGRVPAPGAPQAARGQERPQPTPERSRGSRSEPRGGQVADPRPRARPEPTEQRAARGPVPPGALPPVPQPRHGGAPSPTRRAGSGEQRPAAAPPSGGGKRRLREPADRPPAGEVLPGRDPWDLDQAALPGPGTPERSGGRRRAEDRPDAPRVPQQRREDRPTGDERSASGRRAAPPAPEGPHVPGSGAPRARHRRADIT
ncbi:GAF domain-containing protein [Pseudonocardia halophobica]|uniref:GAF and ANTAR domain-containing protein n=1 Tax=Pseudonocardia halophobica TaxID=29401 RepID=UPI003D8DE95B